MATLMYVCLVTLWPFFVFLPLANTALHLLFPVYLISCVPWYKPQGVPWYTDLGCTCLLVTARESTRTLLHYSTTVTIAPAKTRATDVRRYLRLRFFLLDPLASATFPHQGVNLYFILSCHLLHTMHVIRRLLVSVGTRIYLCLFMHVYVHLHRMLTCKYAAT